MRDHKRRRVISWCVIILYGGGLSTFKVYEAKSLRAPSFGLHVLKCVPEVRQEHAHAHVSGCPTPCAGGGADGEYKQELISPMIKK